METKLYEITYLLSKEATVRIDLTEDDTAYIKLRELVEEQELKSKDFSLYINRIKELSL